LPVFFHTEHVQLPVPLRAGSWKKWLHALAASHGYRIGELNYIFCSDEFLLEMNQTYLHHDTLTDILSFDNSEHPGRIEGDIFISIERVAENADNFRVTIAEELARVMAHGLLHLCGFRDKTATEKLAMRRQEAIALELAETILRPPG